MVQPEELLRLLRQRPFQPFRVHLADGRVFDIRYPELNLVGKTFFDIGIPEPNDPDPFGDYAVMVPLDLISRVEVLVPATVTDQACDLTISASYFVSNRSGRTGCT